MEPILEFSYTFEGDKEEHIINLQIKPDLLIITIELESKGLYWYKELNSEEIRKITSQMGSYKSLKVFTDLLIKALCKKNNFLILHFYSLKKIQELSQYSVEINDESDIRRYLILDYTNFEKVLYPIPLNFLDNNPTLLTAAFTTFLTILFAFLNKFFKSPLPLESLFIIGLLLQYA